MSGFMYNGDLSEYNAETEHFSDKDIEIIRFFIRKEKEELSEVVDVLEKYAKAYYDLELLARNISDQCGNWEDLAACTPASLTKEQRNYIESVYDAYEIIESNEAKKLLDKIKGK